VANKRENQSELGIRERRSLLKIWMVKKWRRRDRCAGGEIMLLVAIFFESRKFVVRFDYTGIQFHWRCLKNCCLQFKTLRRVINIPLEEFRSLSGGLSFHWRDSDILPGVYNFIGGIQISIQGVYNSTGGIQISIQGVYNSTEGIQISIHPCVKFQIEKSDFSTPLFKIKSLQWSPVESKSYYKLL